MASSCDRRAATSMTAFVLALGLAVVSAQSAPTFSALTVPAASLPDGCQLTPLPPERTPTPMPHPEGGVIAAARKPFELRRFPSNPWFGTDYKYIAQVRLAFERLPLVHLPDGPPLEQRQAEKLLSTLKGNIAEAYRASYETTSSGSIVVQAVRYTEAKWATPGEGRIVRGSTVILVTGNPQGECFNAVRKYIQSLK